MYHLHRPLDYPDCTGSLLNTAELPSAGETPDERSFYPFQRILSRLFSYVKPSILGLSARIMQSHWFIVTDFRGFP